PRTGRCHDRRRAEGHDGDRAADYRDLGASLEVWSDWSDHVEEVGPSSRTVTSLHVPIGGVALSVSGIDAAATVRVGVQSRCLPLRGIENAFEELGAELLVLVGRGEGAAQNEELLSPGRAEQVESGLWTQALEEAGCEVGVREVGRRLGQFLGQLLRFVTVEQPADLAGL